MDHDFPNILVYVNAHFRNITTAQRNKQVEATEELLMKNEDGIEDRQLKHT